MDEGHVGMRTLSIKSIDRIHEFYMDLTTYIGYINDCWLNGLKNQIIINISVLIWG